jgi:rod shape-determining protein MreC
MESFFQRYRNGLVLIAVLLVQTIALATQVRRTDYAGRADGQHVRLLRLWMNAILSPPEKLLTRTGHGLRSAWHGYIDLRHTRQQNLELKSELAQLHLHEAAIAEDARQDQRLRSLLEFRQQYVSKTVAAQVIGSSGSDLSRILNIDKGSRDGLRPDMAVITPDGIVGKTRNVFPGTSEVLLINDSSAGAGVILENTRLRGILRGSTNGVPQIVNLLPDNRIHPGDKVVTSGGDRVFPRGLAVGTVKSIAPDPEHQPYVAIVIKAAADLDRLEEVLVITETGPQLQPLPASELSAEEAIATKRASEIVAEHLPGLHDTASPTTTAKPGDKPVPVVPEGPAKAAPALHPDRYSPGAAPPAVDLKPGAAHSQTVTPAPHPADIPKKETPE